MKNDEMKEKALETLKSTGTKMQNIFTKKRLKNALVLLVVAGIMGAGGSYFVHQNKVQAKMLEREARSQIVMSMSQQERINLISQEEAKSIAAKNINTSLDSLTFKEVYLEKSDYKKNEHSYSNKEHKKDGKKHDRRAHTRDNIDGTTHATDRVEHAVATPSQPTPQSLNNLEKAKTNSAMQLNTPTGYIYKVSCAKDKMNYKFTLDAQTGKVLEAKTKATYF